MQTIQNKQWQVSSVGGLLRMTWSGLGRLQWDIDPARGYWIVAASNTVGQVFRKEATEVVEFSPGIWIAKRAINEQIRDGRVFLKVTATVDLDSVKINQPLDPKAFDIVFPIGTRVSNQINHTTEFVGGQNSRDRRSVERLAAQVNSLPTVSPTKEEQTPAASGIRVPEASLWGGGSLIGAVSSFLLLFFGWFSWQRWWRSLACGNPIVFWRYC
ncbi:MAG: hypothetical protein NT013_15145 [Planctomycetia bacterium]|nr:hypothetical protein [Planctomycetia bacterium]